MNRRTHKPDTTRPQRPPDCVTVTRIGDTILTVNGYCDPDARETAEDKLVKLMKAEAIRHPKGVSTREPG